MSSLFRPAAEAACGRDDIGRTLEVGDRWVPTVYHAVVVLLLGALGFVCLVPVNEYATGTGFVRISGCSGRSMKMSSSRSTIAVSASISPKLVSLSLIHI